MGFIDLGVFVVQLANLLVIIWLLHTFFFRAYLQEIDRENADRTELSKRLSDAEYIKNEARTEADAILTEAREHAHKIRHDAEVLAHRESEAILQEAKEEAEHLRERMMLDLANDRVRMREELEREFTDLALTVNAKLFSNPEAHTDFVRSRCREFHVETR